MTSAMIIPLKRPRRNTTVTLVIHLTERDLRLALASCGVWLVPMIMEAVLTVMIARSATHD